MLKLAAATPSCGVLPPGVLPPGTSNTKLLLLLLLPGVLPGVCALLMPAWAVVDTPNKPITGLGCLQLLGLLNGPSACGQLPAWPPKELNPVLSAGGTLKGELLVPALPLALGPPKERLPATALLPLLSLVGGAPKGKLAVPAALPPVGGAPKVELLAAALLPSLPLVGGRPKGKLLAAALLLLLPLRSEASKAKLLAAALLPPLPLVGGPPSAAATPVVTLSLGFKPTGADASVLPMALIEPKAM